MCSDNENVEKPQASNNEIDPEAALQRELDEALGSMSLESLMNYDAPESQQATAGEGVRKGRVIAIHDADIFVDMGGKSQGLLPVEQFGGKALPAVGDTVEVTIEGYDRTDGLLLLSRQGAVQAATWAKLEEGSIVEGRVTGHNKGGLELDINGIKGFMPISQISFDRIESDELGTYVNQRLRCQVVEIHRDEKALVVSRRDVLRQEEQQAREQAFEELTEGQVVHGTVKTIMPYGVFVDIGGIDGLVHISDMSHSRVEDPSELVKEGQQLEVMVLKIDQETKKIGLGLKQIMPDPWTNVESKFPVDTVVSVRIVKLMEFGAFAELEPGVEGLIPISEMSFQKRINHPREVVSEGEIVKVRVLKVDPQAGRISLSIKQVGDDPWMGASVRWPADSVAEGTVTRIAEFGAFVELTPGVEGLIHVSELSDTRVNRVSDIVKESQQVKAKVLEVDEERRRISLSIKQLAEMPDYTGAATGQEEPPRPAKKRKKPLKGGLDW